MPSELGGRGAELGELCDMLRTIAHSCGSTALAFSMHTHQVAIPAWRWRHQKLAAVEPLLKRIAAEKLILLSSGGSDWIGGSGNAVKVDGGYRITARKVFTSGAQAGDLLMTGAILEGETPAKVLHFAVPMKAPEVTIVETWRTLGMRGTGSNDVVIDGLFIPDAGVALARNAGEWHPLFQIIATIAFPLIYAVYLGVAESARDIALGLAARRAPTRISSISPGAWTPAFAPRRWRTVTCSIPPTRTPLGRLDQRGDDRPHAGCRPCDQRRSNWRWNWPAAPASTARTGWSAGSATSRARASIRCSRARRPPMPARWRLACPSTRYSDNCGAAARRPPLDTLRERR